LTEDIIKNAERNETRDYRLSDGGGLDLVVTKSGGKLWRCSYEFNGKERLLSYERGARAVVSLHWDDRRKILSIGERAGSYAGLLPRRTLRIVLVKPGHGVGDHSTVAADRPVQYDGRAIKVDFRRAN
jgi:hypothetical protein